MARMKVTIDDRRMRQRLAGLSKTAPDAARIFAAVMACEVLRFAIVHGPKDTNRYVRAWQQAHNAAARWTDGRVSPWTVFALKESKYHRQNYHRLEQQFRKYGQWLRNIRAGIRYMESKPNHQEWPSYRKAKANEARLEELQRRADQQLAAIDQSPDGKSAIVIGGRKTKDDFALTRMARASVQVYGGDARLIRTGNRVFVESRNREPHAAITERRTKLISSAMKASRAVGLRSASAGYIAKLRAGANRAA